MTIRICDPLRHVNLNAKTKLETQMTEKALVVTVYLCPLVLIGPCQLAQSLMRRPSPSHTKMAIRDKSIQHLRETEDESVGTMNPSKYELTPSTTYTDDDLSSNSSALNAFANLRVVQTPRSAERRRSSTSRSECTAPSWHDSFEDFTDGEDFLTGSPKHANPFREEVDSVGSVRRVKSISLSDPMHPVPSALSLPQMAIGPRSDSPDCEEMEEKLEHSRRTSDGQRKERKSDRSRSTRRQRPTTDSDERQKRRSSKKKSHKKKQDDRYRKSSMGSEANQEATGISGQRDESRRRRNSRPRRVNDELYPNDSNHEKDLKKQIDPIEGRRSRCMDLAIDVEKNVEKAVGHIVLPAAAPSKPKKSSKSHKKKSSHRRRRSNSVPATNEDESSVATEARKRIQEAHVLAMDMLRKAQSHSEYDIDRPPFSIDIGM